MALSALLIRNSQFTWVLHSNTGYIFAQNTRTHLKCFKNSKVEFANYGRTLSRIPKILFLMLTGYTIGTFIQAKCSLVNFPIASATTNPLAGRREIFNYIPRIIDKTAPSVVYIELCDRKRHNIFSSKPITLSNGSGVIVEPDGLILTNAQVLMSKTLKPNIEVIVKLADGRSFPGTIEDLDQVRNLATVRIKCKDLPVIRFGSSKSVKSGKWVAAMGSPLTLYNTVTCGIVSAYRKSKELGLTGDPTYYIQTDASINEGNCGGPLLNLKGETIGINCIRVLPGISFAIPVDFVKKFLSDLKARKAKQVAQIPPIIRYMGVTMLTLSRDILLMMKENKMNIANLRNGVIVGRVIPQSPADM